MHKKKYIKLAMLIIVFIGLITTSKSYGAIVTSKDGKWEYYVKNNSIHLCDYFGKEGTVEIPRTLDGYEVNYITSFASNEVLEHVKIPATIKGMGSLMGAFGGCTNLKTVEIEEGSEISSIGMFEFLGCTNLEKITITSNIREIGPEAFFGCKNLKTIDIGPGIEEIHQSAFSGCEKLDTINIDPNNKNFILSEGVLYDYNKTQIVFYPLTKTDIEYTIPDSVQKLLVSNIENEYLEKINISRGVNKKSINALRECSNLKEIKVDEENTQYTDIDGVLFNKNKTELVCYPCGKDDSSYVVPNTVNTINNFSGNDNLKELVIGKNVTNVTEYAFDQCENLVTIKVDEENMQYTDIDGVLFNKSKTELVCYPCGKGESSYVVPNTVNTINNFSRNNNLKELIIGNNVTNINAYAFEKCENLVIYCNSGSYAEQYAKENNIMHELIDSKNTQVRFKDQAFYNFMKEYLNTRYSIIEGYDDETQTIIISKENILKVNLINMEGKGIKDLSGIEKFTNLVHLYANENQIENIEPLKRLDKIKMLLLNDNNIKNIDALINLTMLTELQLDNNQISKIDVLENLNFLERVFIRNNNVVDISPLDNLQQLSLLVMKNNYQVEDKTNNNIIKGEKIEIELPSVFKYANQKESLVYSEEGLQFSNCKLEQDKVILNTDKAGENVATILINKGNAENTMYRIEYTVKNEELLNEDSKYEIKQEGKNIYLTKINPQTKLQDFIKNINKSYEIEVHNNKGETIENNTTIKTNMKLIVYKNGQQIEKYILVIKGDCNEDGETDIKDILQINKHRLNRVLLTEANLEAGDVNNDGKVDILDILKINKYRLGKDTL